MTRVLLVLAAACSGGKPQAVEDAKKPAPVGGDPVKADAASATVARTPANTGDVQVRVEWKDVPAAVRGSPGTTACGTVRLAQVAPSTTWGIGDVVVIIEGAPGTPGEAHVRLADCALSPRVAIGSTLVVESAADRPAKLVLFAQQQSSDFRAAREESLPPRTIQLPIAGHTVIAALDAGWAFRLSTDAKEPEVAWIVAANGALTDPSGVVLVKDVPVGQHAVRAWLPPRAGQPARHATGQVTVVAGELAELTLQLAP